MVTPRLVATLQSPVCLLDKMMTVRIRSLAMQGNQREGRQQPPSSTFPVLALCHPTWGPGAARCPPAVCREPAGAGSAAAAGARRGRGRGRGGAARAGSPPAAAWTQGRVQAGGSPGPLRSPSGQRPGSSRSRCNCRQFRCSYPRAISPAKPEVSWGLENLEEGWEGVEQQQGERWGDQNRLQPTLAPHSAGGVHRVLNLDLCLCLFCRALGHNLALGHYIESLKYI